MKLTDNPHVVRVWTTFEMKDGSRDQLEQVTHVQTNLQLDMLQPGYDGDAFYALVAHVQSYMKAVGSCERVTISGV